MPGLFSRRPYGTRSTAGYPVNGCVFLYGVRARYRITYGYWQYALSLDFA